MKSDTTTTVLNFLLVLLAVAGVFCAILDFKRTREFRALNLQAMQDKDLIMRVQNLAGEVNAYNQKNPSAALTQILNPPQAKTGSH
jgi:hypothetical protein